MRNANKQMSGAAMKAIQTPTLAACFAAHYAFAAVFDGVRRALQTMASVQAQSAVQPATPEQQEA